jgi:hypothetical protein
MRALRRPSTAANRKLIASSLQGVADSSAAHRPSPIPPSSIKYAGGSQKAPFAPFIVMARMAYRILRLVSPERAVL